MAVSFITTCNTHCHKCMGSSAPAFSCHMNCSQSHRAGKLQLSSSSRSRQIQQEPLSYPEFPSKFIRKSLELLWNTFFFAKEEFLFSTNFASFSNFPTGRFLERHQEVSNWLSLRNTCCISCSSQFSSTSLMRFSLKSCFKTGKADDRSWSCLNDLFHCVSLNRLEQISKKAAVRFFCFL